MKKPSITTLVIVLALLATVGLVAYRIVPKGPNHDQTLAEVKERIKDKPLEQKDEYYKAIGERIAQLNDTNKDNDANALVYMAIFYNNLGEKELALDYYTRALAKDPKSRIGLDNLAHLYEDLGQWDRAEETYLKLIEVHPDYTLGYRSLAFLYQYHFPNGEAKILPLFEKGLNATNNNADLLTWLIQYYQDSGRGEKALPFSKVLADKLNAANKPGAPKASTNGLQVEVK